MTFLTTQKHKEMSFSKTYTSLSPESQNLEDSWLKPMYVIKKFGAPEDLVKQKRILPVLFSWCS
jgi:hypothetical protein